MHLKKKDRIPLNLPLFFPKREKKENKRDGKRDEIGSIINQLGRAVTDDRQSKRTT